MEPFISLRAVKKTYHVGSVDIDALKDATFDINEGEICVIVGASGAGKTTLLNILGGMDSLTSGEVWLDGKNIATYGDKALTTYRRDDIGFVFQFYNLIPNLTALENVELATQIGKNPANPATVLAEVGLEGRMDNFPAQLSGGEQQRVAIARALINNPSTIIADEPTGNLDPARSLEIMRLLERINQLGTTMVVVTHEKDLVNQFKKRVVTLEQGVITSDGDGVGYNAR